MKDLYIVGTGGCGREVLHIIKDIHRAQGQRWNIMGFLDDTEDLLNGKECDYGMKRTIWWYAENRERWGDIVSGEYQEYYKKMYGCI